MEHGAGGEALLLDELPIDGPSPPAQDQRGLDVKITFDVHREDHVKVEHVSEAVDDE